MIVARSFEFQAAHLLPNHPGKCRNLHGHTYRLEVLCEGPVDPESGMVLDFADLKAIAAEILEPFDHRVINDIPPFDEINTTAELFSEYVFREAEVRVAERGGDRGVAVTRVEVW